MKKPNQDAELDRSGRLEGVPSQAEGEARSLAQELQLQQIELEMQNEELLRVQEELHSARTLVDQRVSSRTVDLSRAIQSLWRKCRCATRRNCP